MSGSAGIEFVKVRTAEVPASLQEVKSAPGWPANPRK